MSLPTVIQGGMGAGVSRWPLARAVSQAGQLGVVAGTALDMILARRLEAGDPGGHMRRALEQFPIPGVAQRIIDRYFVEGGKPESDRFKSMKQMDITISPEREELIVAGNFAEVYLAKEGHDGIIGINLLEKIQLPNVASMFGAMLAGVSYILMGAGIPKSIPGIIDDLAAAKPVSLPIDVKGAESLDQFQVHFDPQAFCQGKVPPLTRPGFLAIVSSVTLGNVMAKKANGVVNGLIIEGSIAGGHNAPPRGVMQLTEEGEPIFGPRDEPDIAAIAKIGLPFWLAGSYASPEKIREAQAQGATGVQIGTAFAFCHESGYDPELKQRALAKIKAGEAHVFTDGRASPTGFPFKVFQLSGTGSDTDVFHDRQKVCDLGYLRQAYVRDNGKVGWRCASEPDKAFLKKGGDPEEIPGRKCVCNGLMANLHLGQTRPDGTIEDALMTCGADLSIVERLLEAKGDNYTARDALEFVMGSVESPA